ncbi:MAG: DUF402 domain-containing protein [Armatimonadota bacterium]|nr:DUF402 domain-containing protein [Armatimonadota bacterium]MDR7444565.1 DUF402 domain-containing protein [Armatimonadota bacterium]MDR7570333.1 DUF402 domain-containing protein [Armatimonadota bacterium]MDR7615355.1 DUF402 domain-containing protein [Armatimonadota bacterium]
MGAPFLEIKRRPDGREEVFRCELVLREGAHVVLRYVITHPRQVDDLPLESGTVTYGHFWADRPYNVYHWITPHGESIGCYINLSGEVHLEADRIAWLDLAVDVLIRPGAEPKVLDEEEMEDLPEPLRTRARQALAEVLNRWPSIVEEVTTATRRLLLP